MLISLGIFFACVVIHEFAHAFTAYKLGDTTAKREGRLTLNPLAHIDPVGTLLLPIMLLAMNAPILFGWAKPVPINYRNLSNPKRDIIWVGLSGPLANLLTALLAAILLKSGLDAPSPYSALLRSFMIVSVVLAVFNLIPLPPLDGSRVIFGLLPPRAAAAYARLEPYGFIILFALLYGGLFDKIVWPVATLIIYLLSKLFS